MILSNKDILFFYQFLQTVELQPALSIIRCEFADEVISPVVQQMQQNELTKEILDEMSSIEFGNKEILIFIKNILLNSNVLINGDIAFAHYRILKEIDSVLIEEG